MPALFPGLVTTAEPHFNYEAEQGTGGFDALKTEGRNGFAIAVEMEKLLLVPVGFGG